MAYLYRHIRLDKNEIFYIGIGKGNDGKYKRAKSKSDRNNHWHNIVNCTEYRIEIMLDDLTWKEACQKEIELIALYGRRDLKKGTLVNLTDGGDGGANPSEETRKKNSEAQKGKKASQETRKKMSESRKGAKCKIETKQKIRESLTGKKHSEERIRKNSEAQKGNKNWLGKKHNEEAKQKMSESKKKKYEIGYMSPVSKKVIDTETNEIYNSLKEMCEILGLKRTTICNKLCGVRKNNTPFRYL
jgi:hypothetical protein